LRSFQERLAEFDARGLRLAAISVDSPAINREYVRKEGYTFAFLSDPAAQVIRRYDVLHPGAGPEGQQVARPGEFLIDSTGTVRWVNLTESVLVRARPGQVLQVFDDLVRAPLGANR
jgi:peroxiredoxin